MRRPIVAGNWKMNKIDVEAVDLAAGLVEALSGTTTETVLCPPFTSLGSVARALAASDLLLGAQTVHAEPHGAFTGAISVDMLAGIGCRYVIVGHSERRTLFGETDADVARKAGVVLGAGLRPIVCVGETLEEREAGTTEQVLERQLEQGLGELGEGLGEVVVAYEPVWAIGTGRTATPDQAQSAHAYIRGVVASIGGVGIAEAMRIQYGGSVKPANARELFALPDVDGGLIGGAALTVDSFSQIVQAA